MNIKVASGEGSEWEKRTHRGDGHVKTEAEIGGMQPQMPECWQPAEL